MKNIIYCLLVAASLLSCNSKENTSLSNTLYPDVNERVLAKENTTYYIDPNKGSDKNMGTEKDAPWKTFKKVNQLRLTKGNTIEILSAGEFRESLVLVGKGALEAPITLQFAAGKYDFYPQNAFKSSFHISNANSASDSLKAVAFYFLNSKNIHVKGNGAEIYFRGKAIETSINNCENITVEALRFDYERPTVSEMEVTHVNDRFVQVQIHKDSKYKVADSTLIWVGEGWEHKAQNLWQVFDKKSQRVRRISFSVDALRFSELEKNKVRIYFDENPGFHEGLIYQNRNTFRDYAAFFTQKSKNILWKNVTVNFMHGMGFVNQFSENITFDSLQVRPKENSGRTCATWADILHFSGCKGNIEVKNSYLSAANDDAINVHGTHLRIVDKPSKQKIKVRFIHNETFGLDAFREGDSIEFIRAKTLLPYSTNSIIKVVRLNDHDIELTLGQNIPEDIRENDVIENITWTANVTIQNSTINHIPTRGILITTRGKVLIENNTFLKTHMSGILIADDANFWFESGYVRDVTIRNNKFIECGSPVIYVNPENSEIVDGQAVHKNILIHHNQFKLKENMTLSVKSTDNIEFFNNVIETDKNLRVEDLVWIKDCSNVAIKGNQINKSLDENVSY